MNTPQEPTVFLVEDDPSYQKAIERLLRTAGVPCLLFGSAEDFLSRCGRLGPGCLLLDVRLPGASGLELQRVLPARDPGRPIVFLTGHGDIPMSVRAMKAGAVDFLTKPFEAAALLTAVRRAFDLDAERRRASAECSDVERRYQTLSPREREVFALIVKGYMNKQAAAELGTTERTIKAHRASVMAKMQTDSLADLVRMAEALKTCGQC